MVKLGLAMLITNMFHKAIIIIIEMSVHIIK